MLSTTKQIFTSSFATKQVAAACAIQHQNVQFILRPSSRHHQTVAKKNGLHPQKSPFLFNQLKNNSNSMIPGGFKDDDLQVRRSQMVPRNVTQDILSMTAKENQVVYDEDYDQFYSHMPPSSMKNQDSEQLDGLEMIHHDDIEPPESIRVNYSSTDKELEEATRVESIYNICEEQVFHDADDDYVELEEDWEIMHLSVEQGKGRSGSCYKVYDNVDDVNDAVQ